jgi:hypothetical protein
MAGFTPPPGSRNLSFSSFRVAPIRRNEGIQAAAVATNTIHRRTHTTFRNLRFVRNARCRSRRENFLFLLNEQLLRHRFAMAAVRSAPRQSAAWRMQRALFA